MGLEDIGDCQNDGPFWGPYYNTGPNTGPNVGHPKSDHNFDNPPYVFGRTYSRKNDSGGAIQEFSRVLERGHQRVVH